MCANNKNNESKADMKNNAGQEKLSDDTKEKNEKTTQKPNSIIAEDKANERIPLDGKDKGRNEENTNKDREKDIETEVSMEMEWKSDNEIQLSEVIIENQIGSNEKEKEKEEEKIELDYDELESQLNEYIAKEAFVECEKLCLQTIDDHPLDQIRGRLHNRLAYLYEKYFDNKSFDDVLEHYVLALQVDDSSVDAHFNLANFLIEQGIRHLSRANQLDPEHLLIKQRLQSLLFFNTNHNSEIGDPIDVQVIYSSDDGDHERIRDKNVDEDSRKESKKKQIKLPGPIDLGENASTVSRDGDVIGLVVEQMQDQNHPSPQFVHQHNYENYIRFLWPLLLFFAGIFALGGVGLFIENYLKTEHKCISNTVVISFISVIPLIMLTLGWTVYFFCNKILSVGLIGKH